MLKIKFISQKTNKIIELSKEIIKEGGIIIFPTDTVYGLLCDATNKETIKKLFKIKNRSFKKPIPIFVKDIKMAKKLVFLNKKQENLLKKFWPGKITFILKAKTKKFPKGILSKDKKIGLRIPNYKLLNILLEKLDLPLSGTSANISGKPESTKIKDILNQFKNKKLLPDLIIDAGNLKPSLPSTVFDLTSFKILREGAISKEKIFKILNKTKT